MIILDAEWPTLRDDVIWMVGCYHTDTDQYSKFEDSESLKSYLNYYSDEVICGHRIIFADKGRLKKCWDICLDDKILVDTYTLGTLYKPTRDGGHSLASYGAELGLNKGDFTDYDEPAEGETRDQWWSRMAEYMHQDVVITENLQRHLTSRLKAAGFSEECIVTETMVARLVQDQIDTGLYFDLDKATQLYVLLTGKLGAIKEDLQKQFPPDIKVRYSDKTGKRLKDKITVFNPNSRPQIADRLVRAGVKLKEKTETGQWKISDEVLENIPHPAAQRIGEYMMLSKRIGQLDQWFKYYNESTHRIHGKVNSIGTHTHRQSQSTPNLAQIPSLRKPYGRECRELFCVPDGSKLVGVDASGLELRLLANRMKDPEYKRQVEEGDIHTYNMQMAGLDDRDKAKTFIYAFIYGASNRGLGEILGCTAKRAGEVRNTFISSLPAFKEFKEKTEAEADKHGSVTLLDGSKVWVNKHHLVLNYQLQGDGAVAMKRALCVAMAGLESTEAKLVVQAHDEWQFESHYWNCDLVGQVAVKAIESVTAHWNMYVQLTGEYKVGTSWADTH